MIWEIWMEGFLMTGMEGIPAQASFVASIEADTFKEACDKHYSTQPPDPLYPNDNLYDTKNLTYWGCRLFPNEKDARKSFG